MIIYLGIPNSTTSLIEIIDMVAKGEIPALVTFHIPRVLRVILKRKKELEAETKKQGAM